MALMMEAASISEMSVDNYFTQQYIPEDKSELHTCCRENLKSQKAYIPLLHHFPFPEYALTGKIESAFKKEETICMAKLLLVPKLGTIFRCTHITEYGAKKVHFEECVTKYSIQTVDLRFIM
jgi:hypothetical protein